MLAMDPDAAQALCGASEACAPLIGLSNRACVQLLAPPLSSVEPWIGVIPSFMRTAITANLSSHETCEATRVVLLRNSKEDALNNASAVLYEGMGQWDEAQESCVLVSVGADPLPAYRPSLLFHIPDSEPRDALLVSRRGLEYAYTSSMVEQTQVGITHTIVFPAYPAFGCCAGYDLQVPQTASICGLPSAEAVFSRHIGTPSLDTPERSEYVVPAVPCVMEGFVYTLDKTAPAPTAPPTNPRIVGESVQPQVVNPALNPVVVPEASLLGMVCGAILAFALLGMISMCLELKWRRGRTLTMKMPCGKQKLN